MCDCGYGGHTFQGHYRQHRMAHYGHKLTAGCCHPQSKETSTKQLEARKSQLQDLIGHIDEKIEELQMEEKVEA